MIYTFTLNPCIDRTYTVDGFREGGFSRAVSSRCDLSGKGVNVSLDLGVLGLRSFATGFLGTEDVARYRRHIESYGVSYAFVTVSGAVRNNCKIIDRRSGLQTDVNESGTAVTEENKRALLGFASGLSGDDTAVISGSVPPGFTPDDFEHLVSLIRSRGARLLVDTEKNGLDISEKYGAFAVKPNLDEFVGWTGISSDGLDGIVRAAVAKTARIANVIVSLGADGAIFANSGGAYHARARDVRCISTTGAGDALLAGFIYGASTGRTYAESITLAVACASAKVGCEGTVPPSREAIDSYMNKIRIDKIR